MNYQKYRKQYFLPPTVTWDWAKKDSLDQAPVWCSVDLRDGNQALVEPMGLEAKLEFFQLLVEMGFREIEVGFPAASETEYRFLRTLIEENRIPEGVTIQVLTQAREHIIRKTFEAVQGVPHAIIHLYNSTSLAQREQVFRKSRKEVKQLAVDGSRLLQELAEQTSGHFSFEYSPESFSGTEVDYAVEVCNAVLDVWQPTSDRKMILNIPTTVENAMPHVFASQVEYICRHLHNRESVILSIHPHNDRGCAVATAEMGVLAGADRVEGTLFGNGERTGNVDLITLGMNLFSQGVDPKLDFSNMPHICETYERLTGMTVSPRQPYAGKLVFTAFSGSHQDAIAKGMKWREEKQCPYWEVPYLPIDPQDVGKTYDSDVIRINSQSGKGGVSFILKQNFGLELPERMKEEVGYTVKHVSDQAHQELSPQQVYRIFAEKYMAGGNLFQVEECHFRQTDGMETTLKLRLPQGIREVEGAGNGRLDAVSQALQQFFQLDYELTVYEVHALSQGSSSQAAAYVALRFREKTYWGVGIHEDILRASINALSVAVNRILEEEKERQASSQAEALQEARETDPRFREMFAYIQEHFSTVTLAELAGQFHLSQPYLSKYIKERAGSTFVEILTEIKMEKACALLAEKERTVEEIAEQVGYPSVEHFSRRFKQRYGKTPVQFRGERAGKATA